MENILKKKILTSLNPLLISEDTEKYFHNFINSIINNFQISFSVFYLESELKYEVNKVWNTKITDFPSINNDDVLVVYLKENKYLRISKSETDENQSELRSNSSLYPDLVKSNIDLCFFIELENNKKGLLFFGQLLGQSIFPDSDIKLLLNLIKEMETVIKNFYELRGDIIDERLESMSPTLSLIAHDVRNPIQMIGILIEMLQAKELSLEKRVNLYNKISDGLNQINSIVTEISDFAKNKYDLDLQNINCDKFFSDIKSSVYDSLKKLKIELELNVEYKDDLKIDVKKIRNIILRLIKFSRDQIQYEGLIAINVSNEKNILYISIQDTSEGLKPDVLKNIYDPFFSYANKVGVGLNFAIAKRSIEKHGGTFNIISDPDEGTKFTIKIPLSQF